MILLKGAVSVVWVSHHMYRVSQKI